MDYKKTTTTTGFDKYAIIILLFYKMLNLCIIQIPQTKNSTEHVVAQRIQCIWLYIGKTVCYSARYTNATSEVYNYLLLILQVYLRTSPEICMERMKARCRSEEKTIPMVGESALYTC